MRPVLYQILASCAGEMYKPMSPYPMGPISCPTSEGIAALVLVQVQTQIYDLVCGLWLLFVHYKSTYTLIDRCIEMNVFKIMLHVYLLQSDTLRILEKA